MNKKPKKPATKKTEPKKPQKNQKNKTVFLDLHLYTKHLQVESHNIVNPNLHRHRR